MAKANRKTVTLAAPSAPLQLTYTPANVVGGPVNLALAGKLLGAPVAPTPCPYGGAYVAPAPAPTVTRGAGVSARTAHTWARSVPAANQGNILLPKVHANFGVSQTITVLVNNPKAAGKAPAARFALYGGQGATLTVAAYLAICGKRNIPAAVTHADLMWDFNHGYISVT